MASDWDRHMLGMGVFACSTTKPTNCQEAVNPWTVSNVWRKWPTGLKNTWRANPCTLLVVYYRNALVRCCVEQGRSSLNVGNKHPAHFSVVLPPKRVGKRLMGIAKNAMHFSFFEKPLFTSKGDHAILKINAKPSRHKCIVLWMAYCFRKTLAKAMFLCEKFPF